PRPPPPPHYVRIRSTGFYGGQRGRVILMQVCVILAHFASLAQEFHALSVVRDFRLCKGAYKDRT
ncbi:MAG: hypothetical protein LBD20_03795, partial [Spirochaetaceae bacterium]|nr:hypothetical protein [Spirochaetaceae bacterium]